MILVIVYAEGERKNLFGLERKVKSVSIGQSNTTTANLSFGELSIVTEIFTEWWFWKSLQCLLYIFILVFYVLNVC